MNTNIHIVWIQSLKYNHKNPLIPKGIKDNYEKIITLNKNIKFNKNIWYDENIIHLIKKTFTPYLNIYKNIRDLRFKSDLARLLILYVYGGIYIDIDQKSLKGFTSFDNIVDKNLVIVFNNGKDELSNGFIYVKERKNEYIKLCLESYIEIIKKKEIGACKVMKEIFDKMHKNMKIGENEYITILQERPTKNLEKCHSKEEFWKSFYIFNSNNEPIMKSRYDNYYKDRRSFNNLVIFR
tara:strand:- start:7262 stop:7975 length:714 start_codon:yes stop_codon:yes gene_type:complete